MKIDFHQHYIIEDGYLDNLLRQMDDGAVDKTLLMGLNKELFWGLTGQVFGGNKEVSAAVKAHPDRLIGNILISPLEEGFMDDFHKYLDEGFRCVKIWPPIGHYPDDERLFPMYEEMEKYDIPLLAHCGFTDMTFQPAYQKNGRATTDSRYASPIYYDKLCRLFPKMNMVLAHCGHPYYVETWALSYANPNVYLDIAGGDIWVRGLPYVYESIGKEKYIPIHWNKVVWGTDNFEQKDHMAESAENMRKMGASDADVENILGNNAARLLHLI